MKQSSSKLSRTPDKQLRRLAQPPAHVRAPAGPVAAPGSLQRAVVDPGSASPGDVLALQRSYGNRAVERLLGSAAPVQAQLMVGPAGDRYEQEADRLARQVVSQINRANGAPSQAFVRPGLQREVTTEGAVGLAGGAVDSDTGHAIDAARGGGQPLPGGLRDKMEGAFGADFSGVRVHTDAQADGLNRAVSARAFTTGQDVFFRQGEFDAGSSDGQRLIAHELTHVVQQNGSAVKRQAGAAPGLQRTVEIDGRRQELAELLDLARREPSTAGIPGDAATVGVLKTMVSSPETLSFGNAMTALEQARSMARRTAPAPGTPRGGTTRPAAKKKPSGKKIAGMLGLGLLSVLTGGLAGAVYMGVKARQGYKQEQATAEAEKQEQERREREAEEAPTEATPWRPVDKVERGDILVERAGPATAGSVNRFPETLQRLWLGQAGVAPAGFRYAGVATSSTMYAQPSSAGVSKRSIEGEFFVFRCHNRDLAARAAEVADNWNVNANERDAVRLRYTRPRIYEALARVSAFNGSRALSLAAFFKHGVGPRSMLNPEFAIACYQAAVLKPDLKRLKDFIPPIPTREELQTPAANVRLRIDPERVNASMVPSRMQRDRGGMEPSWELAGVF